MRLSSEELHKVMDKYNVNKLYSWSKVNTYMTSPYEYFLKYVINKKEDNDNCSYAPLGGSVHSIIEKYYLKEIEYSEMIDMFNDCWLSIIDLGGLKFDRNDELKNNSISEKYKYDLQHFFRNHKMINHNVLIEKFITTKIGSFILQGYVDAIFKDDNGVYNIVDWKTSTKYTGNTAKEKCGQLVVYALGLNQMGVPWDKIKICWNFLKYVTVEYELINGNRKKRDIERNSIANGFEANVKSWLRKMKYSDNDIELYIKNLLATNSFDGLPDDIKNKYIVSDCWVYVPLEESLIDKWCYEIENTIQSIESKEDKYRKTKSNSCFWDSAENVKKQSYYFATLCGYSANLHLPYKQYLEELEKQKDNALFTTTNNVEINNETDDIDLSWLDNL